MARAAAVEGAEALPIGCAEAKGELLIARRNGSAERRTLGVSAVGLSLYGPAVTQEAACGGAVSVHAGHDLGSQHDAPRPSKGNGRQTAAVPLCSIHVQYAAPLGHSGATLAGSLSADRFRAVAVPAPAMSGLRDLASAEYLP